MDHYCTVRYTILTVQDRVIGVCQQSETPASALAFLLCPENPQLGWGFSKAFSFGSVIKTPFDLLKQFAVW
nr:hypothetical protein [Yersinia pestis]MDL0464093.1 hypothetical protein [Yersinia pestis]MDL0468052.1 hypothetical protein [Yersinia pestis]MDL0472017.1 hypothetical protein [Yersinia pestis]MDL0475984.1 hypothetical protein [Yersinia pestis]